MDPLTPGNYSDAPGVPRGVILIHGSGGPSSRQIGVMINTGNEQLLHLPNILLLRT